MKVRSWEFQCYYWEGGVSSVFLLLLNSKDMGHLVTVKGDHKVGLKEGQNKMKIALRRLSGLM